MASITRAKCSFPSKRWLVVAVWILAAVVAGSFNLMQYANFHLQNTPRTRTCVRAEPADSGFSVSGPDDEIWRRSQRMDYHKMKTKEEQIQDVLAGIAAGGATAVMLGGSAAATIFAFKEWRSLPSESASPSVVVVPLAQEGVSSIPLVLKAVESLAPEAEGGMLAAVKARAQSVLAELEAHRIVKPPIVAPGTLGPDALPKGKSRDEMLSYYGYQKPNCLYSARK